ncbi:unnamed protein product [Euphydryas editha]|uniref:Serpin domain-containing protein n=1 Tax=Euphydryas editha TaxID=104508 RepID=A0AAU9V867_EUPED|nr:unnamed protein product [Euphydryas editha]
MNIKRMFSPNSARLDNLLATAEELYIDSALQKAFIEVNEEGAEAAAANVFGVAYSESIAEYVPPKVFRADRPFYFEVKSKSLTLFNGVLLSA